MEASETQLTPEKYHKILLTLKKTGIFKVILEILIGKPINEKYVEEYKELLIQVTNDKYLPIVCNINVGHLITRCIVPFGVPAMVYVNEHVILFLYKI